MSKINEIISKEKKKVADKSNHYLFQTTFGTKTFQKKVKTLIVWPKPKLWSRRNFVNLRFKALKVVEKTKWSEKKTNCSFFVFLGNAQILTF